MTKFKIGDVVTRRIPSHRPEMFGVMDKEYTISSVVSFDEFLSKEGIRIPSNSYVGSKYWKLVEKLDPVEEAIKFLEGSGYTIVPPKPKLTGMVYIKKHRDTNHISIANTDEETDRIKIIASVPWTEGDGI